MIDAEADLGLEPGLDPSTDNARVLSAALKDSTNVYPIVFPGKRFAYRQTVVVPHGTAFRFQGMGKHRNSARTYTPNWADQLGPATRHIWQGLQVTFDGWTVKATADKAGDTIKLVGHDVLPTDVGGTLWVVGGTNFTPNTYVIAAADPFANTWTVAGSIDKRRDAANSETAIATGKANGMIGYAGGTHWKDRAYGTWFDGGMNFSGHASDYQTNPNNATKGAIAIHVDTNADRRLNTGKHVFRGSSICNYHVGVLFGRDLRELGHPDGAYTGQSDNHADHTVLEDCQFEGCTYAVVVRNRQSTSHEFRNTMIGSCRTAFYIERGGGISINGVRVNGRNQATNNPTLLRIGAIAPNNGTVTVRDVTFDGSIGNANVPEPQADFKLLAMDESDGVDLGYTVQTVEFDNVHLPRTKLYATPILDAAPGTLLHLTNVRYLRPGSVKLHADIVRPPHANLTRYASAVFIGCTFRIGTNVEDVINDASDAGTVATFIHSMSASGQIHFPDGRYVHGSGFTSFAAMLDRMQTPYRYAGADWFLRHRDDVSVEVINARYLHEKRTAWGLAP